MRGMRTAGPVFVFVVVAFLAAEAAASPTIVGAGNAKVSGCNSGAHVAFDTRYSKRLGGYAIGTVSITTAASCAGMAYRVSLLGAGGRRLAEATGQLDVRGSAAPTFSSDGVPALSVSNVAVAVTG
jgi:hypothetical protein